jgi:hypothetical protein
VRLFLYKQVLRVFGSSNRFGILLRLLILKSHRRRA